MNFIESILRMLELHDPITAAHCGRVGEQSGKFAKRIGLSPAEASMAFTGGILHDIGKAGVSTEVLYAPRALTEKEARQLFKHSAIGEWIARPYLENTSGGKEILQVIRNHHERWDGKGYPDRLKAEEIPVLARLVALTDSYDAMTQDRPYRKAPGHEYAVSEISKGLSSQFDPFLGERFLEFLETDVKKAA